MIPLQIIPLLATPSQTLFVQLAGQSCKINLYQRLSGLYFDLYVSNVLIIGGVICENLNRIVRSAYLGFIGDFVFLDNQGEADPTYRGLGAQFSLIYLEAADLVAGTA